MARNNKKQQHKQTKKVNPQPNSTTATTSADQFPADEYCYELLSQIGGDGLRSAVFKAQCLPLNSAVVAFKTIHLDQSRPDLHHHACNMAAAAAALRHPNLLKPHRVFTSGRRLCVVMPFVPAGSLQSILNASFPDGLDETCVIAAVLKPTLAALSCIHGGGSMHGAISAANILIDSDGSVKLADWGFSAAVTASPPPPSAASADVPYWVEPQHEESSQADDIWAFGVTALEVVWGDYPLCPDYTAESRSMMVEILKRFHNDELAPGPDTEIVKNFSKAGSFADMVRLCLNQDPEKRPSCQRLLAHPFFENCIDGPDFVAKNLLGSGLPRLERRYKKPVAPKKFTYEEDENAKGRRRVVRWVFDEVRLFLNPVYDEVMSNSGEITDDDVEVMKFVKDMMKNTDDVQKEVMKHVKDMMKNTDDQKMVVKDMIELILGLLRDETKAMTELRAEVEKEREKRRAVEMELASLESQIMS